MTSISATNSSGTSTTWWRVGVIALFLIFMIVPVIATALFSISIRWDRTIWPEGFTTQWWVKVTSKTAFKNAMINSVLVSAATVAASLVLVAPTAYWVHTKLPRAKPIIEVLAILPFGLPGVVLALGLIRFYSSVPLPIINTPNILIASYIVITLPFMYRAVINSLESIDTKSLTEAAQILGANPAQVLLRVIVPNIMPGVVNGSLLVFSAVFAEFVLANLLIGTRFKTFPIYLVEFTRSDARQASALALMSFAIAWLIALGVLWTAGQANKSRQVASRA